MSKASKIVEIDGEVLVDRPAAVLIECNGKKEWVPKSQCEIDEDGCIQMPEWIAVEKGFV